MKKLFIELFGTYFLVLIIGLSSGNPIAVGFGLMVLVYCGAHISGAHYNPSSNSCYVSSERNFCTRLH